MKNMGLYKSSQIVNHMADIFRFNYFRVLLPVFFVVLYQCKSSNVPQTPEHGNDNSGPMDIYLLIGQSNMAGRAPIQLQDEDSLNNVYLFTGHKNKLWEKAANPLNKYSTVRKEIALQKLGPGYAFARDMVTAYPYIKIGLVVNAKGGTSIDEWKPGGHLYTEAVNQTKKAVKKGVLKGVLWHQGESNSLNYSNYMTKLLKLIEALRKDFDKANLPFVAGQLSEDNPQRHSFNKMILELPTLEKNTSTVTSENTSTIDGTHFDSASQRILGKRYAKEMINLLKLTKK